MDKFIFNGFSFDFGGLLGGIIGVIGAYIVAVYQIRKQRETEKPSKHKKTYELCIRISEHLNATWTFLTAENFNYSELFKNVIQFNSQLRDYLPEAIETDKRLVSIITETTEGFSNISKEYSAKPRDHEHYLEYENELVFFAEKMRSRCHEIRDEIMKQNKGKL